MDFQIRAVMIGGNVLFKKVNFAVARKTLHQVLRPLKHKIPSQMRETDQRR
jgi:hypothetical protein